MLVAGVKQTQQIFAFVDMTGIAGFAPLRACMRGSPGEIHSRIGCFQRVRCFRAGKQSGAVGAMPSGLFLTDDGSDV